MPTYDKKLNAQIFGVDWLPIIACVSGEVQYLLWLSNVCKVHIPSS